MSDANENVQLKNQVKNLNANIQAISQSLSESVQASINLRTNVILFQQMIQELNQKIGEQGQQVETLNKELAAKQAEIDVLKAAAQIPAPQPEGEADSAAA